jgi:hypothetical protein
VLFATRAFILSSGAVPPSFSTSTKTSGFEGPGALSASCATI